MIARQLLTSSDKAPPGNASSQAWPLTLSTGGHWHDFKDQPYGVVNFTMLRGSVDVARQHCPTKRLTPIGLFVDGSERQLTILGVQMLASYLYYVKGNTKLNRQNYTLKNNPLGLVLWQGRVKMRSGLTLPKSSAKCNPLGLVFIYDCISPIIYANKSICQSSPPQNNPLGLVVYTFFRQTFACFERPTLRGCTWRRVAAGLSRFAP